MKGWASDLLRVWLKVTVLIAAGLLVGLVLVDREHWPVLLWTAALVEAWNTLSAIKSWLFAARYAWFWWVK
ncbi:hypothetical protein ACFWNN_45330 [Lentzea sp. NPDC058450]|uniref:hypothetical protein n=1 Tax=Lentzea sp. NPDC058450 TaxID=3346505 RepID=UPI003655EAB9